MASLNQPYGNMNNRMYMNQGQNGFFRLQENTLLKLLLVVALTYMVWADRIPFLSNQTLAQTTAPNNEGTPVKASLLDFESAPSRKKLLGIHLPIGIVNNVTLALDPEYADRYDLDEQECRKGIEKSREYVERFAPVAVAEMHKYGIPASITIAQALIESNAGESELAQTTNNHFGIKCFSKSCGQGHCVNFTDDSHKDFFVKYNNVWASFRGHSIFLKNTSRYSKLFELASTDYKAWAHGLAKASYASDRKYGEKLIVLINNLELDRFDRM